MIRMFCVMNIEEEVPLGDYTLPLSKAEIIEEGTYIYIHDTLLIMKYYISLTLNYMQ